MAKARRFEVKVIELLNYTLPTGVSSADYYVEVYCGAVMRKAKAVKRKAPVFEAVFQFDVTTQSHFDVFVHYKTGDTDDLLGVLDYSLDETAEGESQHPLYNVSDQVGELKLSVTELRADDELSMT